MTDVEGVRDGSGTLISELDAARGRELLAAGVIHDGMIPKVEAAIRATDGGCATHIIDARVPHALLLELLTERWSRHHADQDRVRHERARRRRAGRTLGASAPRPR